MGVLNSISTHNDVISLSESNSHRNLLLEIPEGYKVCICGDIEGNFERFMKAFHFAFGEDCINMENLTLTLPPNNKSILIFLGDILNPLSLKLKLLNIKEYDNVQLLKFIENNYSILSSYSSIPSMPDFWDEETLHEFIEQHDINRFNKKSSKIRPVYFIEGNHEVDLIKIMKNCCFDNQHIKYNDKRYNFSLHGSSNEFIKKIILFMDLIQQSSIVLLNPRVYYQYICCHYHPNCCKEYMQMSYENIPKEFSKGKDFAYIHGHDNFRTTYTENTVYKLDYSYKKTYMMMFIETDADSFANPMFVNFKEPLKPKRRSCNIV